MCFLILSGGPGWADGYAHPFCYMQMHSEVIPNPEANPEVDMNHLWMGERFKIGPEHKNSQLAIKFGFKKSIIPTRTMYQLGLHMSGVCKTAF